MNSFFYFAYGSNLSFSHMQILCREAVPLGTAQLENYRLCFRGEEEGWLDIEKSSGRTVPVGVWQIPDSMITALDEYEDFPLVYRKENTRLQIFPFSKEPEHSIEGFLYLMNPGYKAVLPTREYWNICMQGYRDFHFSSVYLKDALARCRRDTAGAKAYQ